jgi:N-methylhydantoinase B/oxoprolinase/acetone carboxylase alpha subunit
MPRPAIAELRGPRQACVPDAGAALPAPGGQRGAGRFSGGDGIERDLLFLEDVTVSLITERRISQPWGLQGGEPGAVGENWVLQGGYERLAKRLPDKCTIRLKAGDVLRMLTPGGGGWGPASAR